MAKSAFTAKQQGAQLEAFMRTQLQSLEDAAGVAVTATGRKHAALMKQQVRGAFRASGMPGSKAFFRAFKAYPVAPRDVLGWACYSRAGVPFMHIFQTGGVIAPDKYMVVRLPAAEKLRLPRVSKTNRFRSILNGLAARYGKHSVWKKQRGEETVYYLRVDANKVVPIYRLTRQVKLGKRIKFHETAEALAREMPEIIQRIVQD